MRGRLWSLYCVPVQKGETQESKDWKEGKKRESNIDLINCQRLIELRTHKCCRTIFHNDNLKRRLKTNNVNSIGCNVGTGKIKLLITLLAIVFPVFTVEQSQDIRLKNISFKFFEHSIRLHFYGFGIYAVMYHSKFQKYRFVNSIDFSTFFPIFFTRFCYHAKIFLFVLLAGKIWNMRHEYIYHISIWKKVDSEKYWENSTNRRIRRSIMYHQYIESAYSLGKQCNGRGETNIGSYKWDGDSDKSTKAWRIL